MTKRRAETMSARPARPLATLVLALALLAQEVPAGFLQSCGDNSPAIPVPEVREGVRLWPPDIQPANPGQVLPRDRDSTQRVGGNTVPNAATGHELFKGIDAADGRLVVAYGLGLSVWDIRGARARQPRRIAFADLWENDFLVSVPQHEDYSTEQLHFVQDVSALSLGSGKILIGLAAKMPIAGPTLWTHSAEQGLTILYEDAGDGRSGGTNALEGVLVESNGRQTFLTAGGSSLSAYDASAALNLVAPCQDSRGTNPQCPEVYLGVLPGLQGNSLDAKAWGERIILAAGGTRDGVLLAEVLVDAAGRPRPATTRVLYGAGELTGSPALFEHDGRYWLALVRPPRVEILDITDCVLDENCSSPPTVWHSPPLYTPGTQFLTYSESDGVPFLYYGLNAHELSGEAIEQLWDLRRLKHGQVREITEGGGTTFDACSGGDVGYWSAYYGGNTGGLRGFEPRRGVFVGSIFYRVAETVFDVHIRSDRRLFSDGFDNGDLSAWTAWQGVP